MMTREMPPARLAEELQTEPEAGPFNSRLSLGYLPVARPDRISPRPGVDHAGAELGRDAENLRRVPGADGVRPALADSVSRHQPRLAGERPCARRDHDGVRIADRRHPDRRSWRVRRRHARGRSAVRGSKGGFSGDRHARVERRVGQGRSPTSSSKTAMPIVKNAVHHRRASREITADGQFSLGYPRKDGGEEINARVRLTRRPHG